MPKAAFLALALTAVGAVALAAQAQTNLDDLVQRDDVFVHPQTLEPHTGPVVRWWDMSTPRIEGTLRNGRWDGVRVTYYPTGRVSARETFRDGFLHGPAEAYFKSGQLSARESFTNGRLDGPYETYWTRGALAEQGTWANGRPCGEWTSFGQVVTYPSCPRSGG